MHEAPPISGRLKRRPRGSWGGLGANLRGTELGVGAGRAGKVSPGRTTCMSGQKTEPPPQEGIWGELEGFQGVGGRGDGARPLWGGPSATRPPLQSLPPRALPCAKMGMGRGARSALCGARSCPAVAWRCWQRARGGGGSSLLLPLPQGPRPGRGGTLRTPAPHPPRIPAC